MYGTRDAGAIWELTYTSCLTKMGFVQGGASPCCFTHPEWKVSVVVHCDDFTALGSPEGLSRYEAGMQKTFECKLKGRLGMGDGDCKEMRVLNRIVRISEHGLTYEADPRHAEMLIKSFHLEESKPVVTPGVKTSIDEDVDPQKVDAEASDGLHKIIAELKAQRSSRAKVTFSPDATVHYVTAYSEVYGRHPREFEFDKYGKLVSSYFKSGAGPVVVEQLSPNMRRAILDKTLREGAAWETKSSELIARVAKGPKKKFIKARLGSKAAKHAERMEAGGDDLDQEAATMYRALSARLLYLSMDRPEVAFAAKELCRHFANPTKLGVEALKRAVRFLVGLPRLAANFLCMLTQILADASTRVAPLQEASL